MRDLLNLDKRQGFMEREASLTRHSESTKNAGTNTAGKRPKDINECRVQT